MCGPFCIRRSRLDQVNTAVQLTRDRGSEAIALAPIRNLLRRSEDVAIAPLERSSDQNDLKTTRQGSVEQPMLASSQQAL